MSLIQTGKTRRMHLLSADSFENTFGPKAQRKKPKLTLELNETLNDNNEEDLPFTSFPSEEPAPEPTEEDTMQLFLQSTLNKHSLFLFTFFFLKKYNL